jgi:hypothetical protein
VECYGVFFAVKFLTDNHAEGEIRCVGVHMKRFRPVWGSEYGVGAAEILQRIKGGLFVSGPAPLSLFLG